MADVTVKHIDDLDSYEGRGTFLYARKGLGVTSFGMNVGRWPAGTHQSTMCACVGFSNHCRRFSISGVCALLYT